MVPCIAENIRSALTTTAEEIHVKKVAPCVLSDSDIQTLSGGGCRADTKETVEDWIRIAGHVDPSCNGKTRIRQGEMGGKQRLIQGHIQGDTQIHVTDRKCRIIYTGGIMHGRFVIERSVEEPFGQEIC